MPRTFRAGVAGKYLDTTGGQIAILLDFVEGVPGDKLIARAAANDSDVADTMLRSLGATLAKLHDANLAEKLVGKGTACFNPARFQGDQIIFHLVMLNLILPQIHREGFVVRHVRSGWPVSNMGDLLAEGKAEADFRETAVASEPFSSFVLGRLERFRGWTNSVTSKPCAFKMHLKINITRD